jgi:hypothetical protein
LSAVVMKRRSLAAGGCWCCASRPPARLVDLHLEPVHFAVLRDHLLSHLRVALGERAHRVGDLHLHLAAQAQQLVAEVVELRVVGLVGVCLGHLRVLACRYPLWHESPKAPTTRTCP